MSEAETIDLSYQFSRLHRWGNPARTARASIQLSATAAQNCIAYLNNDAGPNTLIAVLNVSIPNQNNLTLGFASLQRTGAIAGNRGIRSYTGEAAPGGVTTGDSLASINFSRDFFAGTTTNYGTVWPFPYPFALLRSGWSFIVTNENVNQALWCSYFYELIRAEEIDALVG